MNDKTILLIEDNTDDIDLTLRAFKKNNITHQVVVARDGVEALDYIFGIGKYEGRNTNNSPELILLDLKLPRVNGLEVLKRLRSDKRVTTTPIVVLSSSREQQDLVNCYEQGANSYIVKPVDFGRFNETIALICRYWLQLNETFTQS